MDARLQKALERPFLLEVGPEATPADLDSYISRLGIDAQRYSTSFVFRIQANQMVQLADPKWLEAIFELLRRAPNVPLFALALRGRAHDLYTIEKMGLARLPAEDEQVALGVLRSADLHAVVDEAKDACFLTATTTNHFVAPSGQHCEAFFRLGDAIRSKSALDRMAFWIAPAVASAEAVVVDNWSISAVVLRALLLIERNIPFDCLPTHPAQDRREAERIIAPLVAHVEKTQGVLLFLVSVTSSGTFASTVREIAGNLMSAGRMEIMALYGLTGAPEDVDPLCTLDFEPKNFPPEECPWCRNHKSRPVPLDPSLYYLKAIPETGVPLRRTHFVDRAFIDRFNIIEGAFSVHRDDRFGTHHAFFVDFAALVAADELLAEECKSAVEALRGPEWDLIITPTAGPSALGQMASEVLDVARVAFDSPDQLSAADKTRLDAARNVLVIDDVLVSGRRIENCVKWLREKPTSPRQVAILVGLARPPSVEALEGHRVAWASVTGWSFNCVHRLCLPDWQIAECPWCEELGALTQSAASLPHPPLWLTDRIARLTERDRGVLVEPMLLLPGAVDRQLGHTSYAANRGVTAMACLFSVASGLQHLRHDKNDKNRLHPYFPMRQVMKAKNLDNYSENLLRATLLRTVRAGEWGWVEKQELSRKLVDMVPRGRDACYLSGEILLGMARDVLDLALSAPACAVIERWHPGSKILFPR